MRGLAALVFVAGCYSAPREAPCTLSCSTTCPSGLECNGNQCTLPGGGCGPGDDAGDVQIDAELDAPQPFCYGKGLDGNGPGLLRVCLDAPPAGTTLLSGTIDTDNSSFCTPLRPATFPEVCLIAADQIEVPAAQTTRFEGARAVVLLAPTAVRIQGTLDVSSTATERGAGSSNKLVENGNVLCNAGMNPGDRGGGAGGSFRGQGGDGGADDGNGSGGRPAMAIAPLFVRGGCDGQSGGGTVGLGGAGGGAVYIISAMADISGGTINASGAGGGGSFQGNGASGGGSGGLIGFDITALQNNNGKLVANGGGGGCGAALGFDGPPGGVANPARPDLRAAGCSSGFGGQGSAGSGASNLAGQAGDTPATGSGASGDGGGGGAGDIVFTSSGAIAASGANVSPDPRLLSP